MHTRRLILIATFALVAVPGVGLAQDQAAPEESAQPDYAAAKSHFKAGQELLAQEKYGEAVEEFTEAFKITQDGLVMGQVAEAFAKAGDYERALEAIQIYRDALPAAERGPAERLIKQYKTAVKEGRSQRLLLPSEKPPEKPAEPEVTPPETSGSAEKDLMPLEPTPEPDEPQRFYTWIAAGSAGALLLGALVVGLNAQSEYDDLSDKCKPNCFGAYASDVDSVETRALVADILWGTALAAGITAGFLYWWEGRNTSTEETREIPELDSDDGEDMDIFSRVNVAPVVGAGSYGVSAGLRF